MNIDQVRQTAYAMPLTNPSFPRGPYRFFDREYLIITYRTDVDALRAVVPEPLEIGEPLVKYEFIRMPDSTGFGDYTESGQVIPVRFQNQDGHYVHSMYLDNHGPIAGGREIWGFPKKLARPKISRHGDVIVGTLHYGRSLCARATMGYKHRAGDAREVVQSLQQPNFVLKIIPHVDGSARICELVRYRHEEVRLKECWAAPAELQLFRHVFADVAKLPVLEIVSAQHLVADLTLGHGQVVYDYLAEPLERSDARPHAWKEAAHAAR